MHWFYVLSIGALGTVFSLSEEEGMRRVQAHLLIDDSNAALREAASLMDQYPDSKRVGVAFVEALASSKMEEEAFDAWHGLSLKHPDILMDRHLLEELAWGVLRKGLESTQNGVRLAALIGAYLTHDVRAVPILRKMMRDSNAVIRSVAVQMACSYRDAPLKDEIVRLMEEERVWIVRLEVIKAAGALKMQDMAAKLQGIVQSEKSTYEERHLAIEALLNIYEKIPPSELGSLVKSNRAGIRHLACSIAEHFKVPESQEDILKLLQDPHPDVRIAALNAFGLFYREKVPEAEGKEALMGVLSDPNAAVAISAAWAAALIEPSFGLPYLARWLVDPLSENRRLAAAALSSLGGRGTDLSLKMIRESEDPYVAANLALGLLGQRVEVRLASDVIYHFLQEEKRMWMWEERPNPLFRILAPSQVRHVDHIPNYPEAIDQMTRLNLLSLLAVVEDPRSLLALKHFLQKRTWGITGVAAATLLQEGDDSALAVVKQLVHDSEPNVRLQACLVLAMMGRDESVLSDLQRAYTGEDHQRKLHILEALGRMGNASSFSFLISVFREPFPILRVAAAAALIQCANR